MAMTASSGSAAGGNASGPLSRKDNAFAGGRELVVPDREKARAWTSSL